LGVQKFFELIWRHTQEISLAARLLQIVPDLERIDHAAHAFNIAHAI
jgi:hypothetical protein